MLENSSLGGPRMPAPPRRAHGIPPQGAPKTHRFLNVFSMHFGIGFCSLLARFSLPTCLPKPTKILQKSMPRGIPSWPSLFTWFFIEFSSILQPFEPSKSWFFLGKNKVFSKNGLSKLASIFLRFCCQLASIFPPKIHSNRM